MGTVEKSIEIQAPAEEVWQLIGNTGGISTWVPALSGSEVSDDGHVRSCTMQDGTKFYEDILKQDDAAREYEYAVRDGVMPMTGFRGNIKVDGNGASSKVVWKAKFTAAGISEDEAVEMIGGIYDQGLQTAKQALEGS